MRILRKNATSDQFTSEVWFNKREYVFIEFSFGAVIVSSPHEIQDDRTLNTVRCEAILNEKTLKFPETFQTSSSCKRIERTHSFPKAALQCGALLLERPVRGTELYTLRQPMNPAREPDR